MMRELERWVLGCGVNALWQAPVIFAAGWLAARLVRRMGAAAEHTVWVAALMAEAVVPGCSGGVGEWLRGGWALLFGAHGAAGVGQVRVVLGDGVAGGVSGLRLSSAAMLGLAMAYGCGVAWCAGRLVWGLWRTRAMRLRAVPYGAGLGCEVAVSERVSGPVTVGWRRGVMLVPPGFLESVDAGDLEAVVAHERAHMRRWDFAKNVAYGVMTLPVALHPAVWLTRARVAATREMVCDQMAAEAVAGRERYARSLLRLASLLMQGTPERTLHAIGIFDANMFERRVMNLTAKYVEVGAARRWAMAAACVAIGVTACGSAMALRLDVGAPAAVVASAAGSAAPLKVETKIMAGQVLSKKMPVYPVEAKAKGDIVNGAVVLDAVIGKDGAIKSLRIKKSLRKDYDTSALDAVKDWTYKPYLVNGEPVEVETTVTVNYSVTP